LVEVLKQIDRTLKERGEDALAAEELKRAAINRVFGFEILPAPFVVAHLQMGVLLQSLGAPRSGRATRPANSLAPTRDPGTERDGSFIPIGQRPRVSQSCNVFNR